jgi:DNA-binding Xre family transcriptional regulator
MMKAVLQSNLDQLLAQRGWTVDDLQHRLAKERKSLEPGQLQHLRDVSHAVTLDVQTLTSVLGVLGCDLSDLLTVVRDVDVPRLRRLATHRFPQRQQRRMDYLLSKGTEGDLTPRENVELHELVREFEAGTVAQARALKALAELGEDLRPLLDSSHAQTH